MRDLTSRGLTTPKDGVYAGAFPAAQLPVYALPGLQLAARSSGAFSANTIYYVPVTTPEMIHVVNLVAEVTSGNSAGRAIRLGLYEADFNNQPVRLLAEGEASAASTGVKSVSVDRTISAGRYLLAFNSNNASISVRWVRIVSPNAIRMGDNHFSGRMAVASAYGAFGDPGVAWTSMEFSGASPDTTGSAAPVFLEVTPPPS